MGKIQVGGSLQPGTVDTPLDARTRIATLDAVAAIQVPYVGMTFYVIETGKLYIVKSLKAREVGSATVALAAVDQYEELVSGGDIDIAEFDNRYAQKDHDHEVGDVTGLQTALDGKAAADHDHEVGDVTGLQTALDAKAAADHDHAIGDVTGLQTALDGKAAADHDHAGAYAPLVEEKIPEQYFPTAVGARPATLSLPVPYDENGDNMTLVVDICENENFDPGTYNRINMTVWYAKMSVFSDERFYQLEEQSLGIPYYGSTVSFTLDQEMFPGYVPGRTYFARYMWIDTKQASTGWKGFKFSGDVADMEPIHTNFEPPLKVKDTAVASGELMLDYLAGEIQNYTMEADVTVRLANVSNVPFGAALLVNIKRTGGTLTVRGSGQNLQTYDEDKTYMLVVSNFGELQVAVTETV